MAKTDIKLYATDPVGKQTTATISDVNPDATNAQLKTLGQMLNQFTENVYDSTYRINTIHCDSEAGGGQQTATITLETASVSLADFKAALKGNARQYAVNFTYDGDATPYAVSYDWSVGVSLPVYNSSTQKYLFDFYSGNDQIADQITAGTITIRADETDNYKAAEATFTITA